MLNKNFKPVYEAEIRKAWHGDDRMTNYCVKQADIVVVLSDGNFITVEKPSIRTRFCFGYSDSRYNTDDFDRANDMARYAAESQDYFVKENLEHAGFDWKIEKLRDFDRYDVWVYPYYSGQPEDCRIYCFTPYNKWEDVHRNVRESGKIISNEDRELIAQAYEQAAENFKKRLATYLKRYGMTKVETWSYWQDR